MQMEIRHIPGAEIRAMSEGSLSLRGYAAVYNSDSVDFGEFKEQILPGAFTRTLREKPDIRALVDHDSAKVIGRTKSGTLALREDERGLIAEIDPPDTSHGRDIIELVKRGDVDGMSFGFIVKKDKWEKRSGSLLRSLIDVDLLEVSIVAFPAYPATQISARSAQSVLEEYLKTEVSEEQSWRAALSARMRKLTLMERAAKL